MDYDKAAFLAGYEAGRALKRWRTKPTPIKGVKEFSIRWPYTVVWNSPNSFTLTWTIDNYDEHDPHDDARGIILAPNLFPVRLTATSSTGGRLQYGICTIDGILYDVISYGQNRVSYANGLPNQTIINDDTQTLRSVFCGGVFYPPVGTTFALTVEW